MISTCTGRIVDQRPAAAFDLTRRMYHGTAAAPFTQFHSFIPAFFTSSPAYAQVYMERGDGQARIVEAALDVRRPFTGRSPAEVAFWNEGFVPWMKEAYPTMAHTLEPIEPRDSVPFVWANEFFVYLRRMARAGACDYDGMIVDETATAAFVEEGQITVVPLHVSQITIIG